MRTTTNTSSKCRQPTVPNRQFLCPNCNGFMSPRQAKASRMQNWSCEFTRFNDLNKFVGRWKEAFRGRFRSEANPFTHVPTLGVSNRSDLPRQMMKAVIDGVHQLRVEKSVSEFCCAPPSSLWSRVHSVIALAAPTRVSPAPATEQKQHYKNNQYG